MRLSRWHRARTGVSWVVLLGVLMTWWLTLAPTWVGGPAFYGLVTSGSMEPTLAAGDLVITRPKQDYDVGDLVVVETEHGALFGRMDDGLVDLSWWVTDRAHDAVPEMSWPELDVVGAVWHVQPAFAGKAAVLSSPWFIAIVAALLVSLWLLPPRLRRNDRLEEALRWRASRTTTVYRPWEVAALVVTGAVVTLGGLAGWWVQTADRDGFRVAWLALVLPAAAIFVALVLRVRRGVGLREPRRSLVRYAAWSMVELGRDPEITGPVEPVTGRELLRAARDHRLPVLHVADEAGHRFWVLDADWAAEHRLPAPETEIEAATGPVVVTMPGQRPPVEDRHSAPRR